MSDRRTSSRLPCRWKVNVCFGDGTTELFRAFDFSLGGIQIHSPRQLPEGTPLRIAVCFFSPRSDRPIEIRAFAHVAYNIYDSIASCFRIGLTTTGFEGDGKELWEREFSHAVPKIKQDADATERRVEPRFHYRHSVLVSPEPEVWITTVTADLSRSGMRISIDRRIEPGRLVRLRMKIVHPKSGEVCPVGVTSAVSYSFHAAGGGFDMGVVHRHFEVGEEALEDEIRYRLEPFASTLK